MTGGDMTGDDMTGDGSPTSDSPTSPTSGDGEGQDPGGVRVEVDRVLCDNHGQCVYAAPAVFAFDDDERLQYTADPDAGQLAAVQAAVAACPVRAIAVTATPPVPRVGP